MPREADAVTALSTPPEWGEGIFRYSVGVEVGDIGPDDNKTWRPLKAWQTPQNNDLIQRYEHERLPIAIKGHLASEFGKVCPPLQGRLPEADSILTEVPIGHRDACSQSKHTLLPGSQSKVLD